MAIHANHPGLTVEVMVDDEALPEYVDNEDSSVGNEVIRYIEARSGAEFEIWYTFDEAFPTAKDVGVLVDIDGKSVDDAYFSRQESHTSPFATQGVEMKIGSNWVLQCLSFVDLQISELMQTFRVGIANKSLTQDSRRILHDRTKPFIGRGH
jgi:hypothetical protein